MTILYVRFAVCIVVHSNWCIAKAESGKLCGIEQISN